MPPIDSAAMALGPSRPAKIISTMLVRMHCASSPLMMSDTWCDVKHENCKQVQAASCGSSDLRVSMNIGKS
jgi:hypothetical protein